MTYFVKEIFYTLQGEGLHAGRPAVFCRFTGCNLWSGVIEQRSSALCSFCDTDFAGTNGTNGGRYESAAGLARAVAQAWPEGKEQPYVVFTGGEPALQLDADAVQAVKGLGFQTAIETNGTLPLPPGLDWTTVSPKEKAGLALDRGDELKLVYPQNLDPSSFLGLKFRYYFLQPLFVHDAEKQRSNAEAALRYCLEHPPWRLTLQHQRLWGIR